MSFPCRDMNDFNFIGSRQQHYCHYHPQKQWPKALVLLSAVCYWTKPWVQSDCSVSPGIITPFHRFIIHAVKLYNFIISLPVSTIREAVRFCWRAVRLFPAPLTQMRTALINGFARKGSQGRTVHVIRIKGFLFSNSLVVNMAEKSIYRSI